MRRRALYAIAVIDATLASLGIDIEVLQIVIKINGASAQIAAEQGGVGGEDGGDVDLPLLA